MKKILLFVLTAMVIFSAMPCAAQEEISEISLKVAAPVRGESPAAISQIVVLQEDCDIYAMQWKQARGQTLVNMQGNVFGDGEQYYLVLEVYTKNSKKFAAENIKVTVNGEVASSYGIGEVVAPAAGGHKIITIGFPKLERKISSVKTDVIFPAKDTFPQKPYVLSGMHGSITNYKWVCNGLPMYMFEKFKFGNSYKLEMTIKPNENYVFDSQRELSVTLNGKECSVNLNDDGTVTAVYDYGKILAEDYEGEHLKLSKGDMVQFNLPELYFEDGIDWHQIYMDSGHEMTTSVTYDWYLKNLKTGEEKMCVADTEKAQVKISFDEEGEYLLYCKGLYRYMYNDITSEFHDVHLSLAKVSKPYRISVQGKSTNDSAELLEIIQKNIPTSFSKISKYLGRAYSTLVKEDE